MKSDCITLTTPAQAVRVMYESDICVIGGSCTGVFAAVRAARLGAKVVIIERQGFFGGTAVGGLVNVWHTLYDTDYKNQVIAGLTDEVEQLLKKQSALEYENTPDVGCRFNSARLCTVLDRLVTQSKITPLLHAFYSGCITENGVVKAITVNTKSGTVAVAARFFIDATGDGDVARDLKIPMYKYSPQQPPSSCFLLHTDPNNPVDIGELIKAHGSEFGLDNDWGWGGSIPGVDSLSFRADTHVFGVDCSDAEQLTKAELEGRRKAAAVSDLLKKYGGAQYELAALCSSIGIRDTVHFKTDYTATEHDLLQGIAFAHTIMHGTYRLDVHDTNGGITFKYLDGRAVHYFADGSYNTQTIKTAGAKYYSAPWELLVQRQYDNFIAVGRMINAESGSFGALRVMVNLNQLGEAAGVAAALCCEQNTTVSALDGDAVCAALKKGGSAV